MAKYGSGDEYSYPWGGQDPPRPDLRHKQSSTSDVSLLAGYQPARRDSVVSLPSPTSDRPKDEVDVSHVQISSGCSEVTSPYEGSRGAAGRKLSFFPETLRAGTPSPTTQSIFSPFRTSQYEPIWSPNAAPSKPRRAPRRSSGRETGSSSSLMGTAHGTIPENEEIDMSLLASAMPMGIANERTAYPSVEEADSEFAPTLSPTMSVDVSSLTGPPQNELQLKEVNRQEAAGILTGGLGAGWKPGTTIKSTDLYAIQPTTPRTPGSMSRRMSFRRPSLSRDKGLARTQTVRELGQIEANKRGEIIEVIVEEPTFDISSFAGDSSAAVNFESMNGATTRKNTLHVPNVEVFYPQDNWKPFSMRWPYITTLIVISISLAVAQEVVLQKGAIYTFVSASKLSTWNYFTFKYLPTLVAVSFGVLWQVTDFEVKRLEAYYQLSRQGGALAAESINVDYITFFNFLRPIRALTFKHYAVAVSSQATLMAVSLVPTLQAASIELRPTSRAAPGSNFADEKQIAVNTILSRILSAVLVTIAVLGSILVWQLGTRPSGLVADVKGIAGIAAMANRSHILMDFKNMDTATPEMIHQTLKSHRYSLRNSSLAPEDKVPLTQAEKDKYDQQTRHGNPHPLMLRLVAGIPFITVMVLFIALVPIVLFVPALADVTTRAPWFLTALAVGIKLAWGTLETDVRMMEPFYILSKRHASPRVLTLDYTAMAFGWMPIRAFINGHLLVGLVGLGSVLAEILTVCSSSFAGVHGREFFAPSTPSSSSAQRAESSGEETFLSFWLSFGLALLILAYLCCVAALVYVRRRHMFLPRQPSTIASVLAFIHQSKMLYDYVGTEKMNNDEMVERLARVGKTYGLGWFTGRDGEMHCGVDEEELVSAYKHGRDERKAIQPWSTQWENY